MPELQQQEKPMSMLIRMLVVALFSFGIITVIVWFFQDRMVYFPSSEMAATPESVGLAFEEVSFRAADNTALHGWYVPARDARATLLFCHGNGGNISHRLDSLLIFQGLGLNVFIFDYRGYGLSSGRPGEQGMELDAQAAWHWLIREKQADPATVIIFGRSLGGAVAAGLACDRAAAGLILESSFTSYTDIGRYHYPWLPVRFIAKYRYAAIEKVRLLDMPLLVVHSPADELVPFRHGRALYDACSGRKFFLEISGGHNDGFLVSGETYIQGLDAFITAVVPSGQDAPY
jgi:fermentation-respiration switch protein FrsA (DUF1100 family)